MPALWIAILVGRLFLTSLSPTLFSPGQPDHPQEECQAQAAVARSLFSWRNKSPSLLGYLKCEAKPKASSHYCPCRMSPQSPTLDLTILVIRCTDFKTWRYFIHQKWGLTPAGNWQNYFYPAKINYTKIPHPGFSSWSFYWLTPSDRTFFSHWIPSAPFHGPLVSQELSLTYSLSAVPGSFRETGVSLPTSLRAHDYGNVLCSANTSYDRTTQQVLNKCL